MIASRLTIGILTPEVIDFRSRRDFFVRSIASMRAAIEERGGQALVVLGQGQQLAWKRVDAWIVIADAEAARELQQANKAIVTLNVYRPELGIPAVLPDNQAGTRAAVRHLIEHGHTRIAFVGARRYFDIEQRYQAYIEALAEHGIALDSRLVIVPDDNDIKETRRSCEEVLPDLPCTVVMCGTDTHAMAVLEIAQAAGLRIPEDLAIVGFDDIEPGQYLRPSLTTVRQDVEALGRTAVRILCSQLAGATPPPVTMVPTQLIVRRSCGCRLPADMPRASLPSLDAGDPWQDWLMRQMVQTAQFAPSLSDGALPDHVWSGCATIVRAIDAALQGSTLPHRTDLERACDALVELTDNLERSGMILTLLEHVGNEYLQTRPHDINAPARLQAVLMHIRLEFTRAYQLAEQRERDWLVQLLHLTHQISTMVFGENPLQAQQLIWLQETPARMGCLGLWVDHGGAALTELVVAGTYARDGSPLPPLGSRYLASDFPPIGFQPAAITSSAAFSILIPLKTPYRNWGVLHLWPQADAPYFAYVLWARLLSSALERASLLTMVNRLVTSSEQFSGTMLAIGQSDATGRSDPQHAEVQMLCIEQGSVTYLLGGSQATLMKGQVGIFWAAMPHHIVWMDPDTKYSWVKIPLAWVLQHRLPDTLIQPLLYGKLVVDQESATADIDTDLFRRWDTEMHLHGAEGQAIVLLEIEARLRRFARSAAIAFLVDRGEEQSRIVHKNAAKKTEQMARFIADHYTEEVRIGDIARAVGLNPSYAITLFRTTTGMSPVAYLTQYRIAHAQRLLVTTDAPIAHIALEAGFSSISQFYAVFKRACEQSPSMYRASPRTSRSSSSF